MATSITVQGTLRPSPSTTATGYIRFVPTHVISDTAGNVLVTRDGVEDELSAGAFSVTLYANDDPTTTPTGTAYKAYHIDERGKSTLIKTFVLPYDGGTPRELADLPDTEPGEVYTAYATQAALTAHLAQHFQAIHL